MFFGINFTEGPKVVFAIFLWKTEKTTFGLSVKLMQLVGKTS
jgi:hypothetical protein